LRRLLFPLAVVAAATMTLTAVVPATGADGPPVSQLNARSVLPPGEDGFFTADEQAAYEATGDRSVFGDHVDDQREMFWSSASKPAGFQQPTGTPVTPADGVRIYRDDFGVPLIYGDSGHDVWFGAGYAAAIDRLFEMDGVRRTALGTLAELTGPGGVPADIQERVLTYTPAEYQAMLDELSPVGRTAITAYAEGVQARIEDVREDPSLLPAEYQLLSSTPEDWTVQDTLAAGVYATRLVASQGGLEMDNVATLRELQRRHGGKLGRRMFGQLFPDDNPRALTTVTGKQFWNMPKGSRSVRAQRIAYRRAAAYAATVPLSLVDGVGTGAAKEPTPTAGAVSLPLNAADVRAAAEHLLDWRSSLHGGSFAYAISGKRTASGHAMLVSDPQLDYSYPSLLFELEVHGGGYDARGVGIPGVPTVGIGHNGHVAWGLTTGYSKTIDSYIETTRPNPADGRPPQYRHDGAWHDMTCRTETVHYRQAPDGVPTGPPVFEEDYRVCRTVHGPVVATTPDGRHARSVSYAMWKHEIKTVEGILQWNRARDLDDVARGVRHVTWNENIVAADSHGHIGFWHPGRHFRRPARTDQRFPLDGRGAQDMRGMLPFRRLPHVVDPKSGFVANWNNKPAHGWFDGDLSGSNSRPGGAAQRMAIIRRLLAHAHDLKPGDLMRLDTRIGAEDMRAIGYLPAMLQLRGADGLNGQQRSALRLLARWDGRAYAPGERGGSSPETKDPGQVTDGPAATLFQAWRNRIVARLFHRLPIGVRVRLDSLGITHQYDVTPLDNLALRVLRPRWAGLGSPTAVVAPTSLQRLLRRTLAAAIVQLTRRFGEQPRSWRRPHGITMIESLTGVLGPAATEPFEDRGSWVQHVFFTRGRPR
jgi:penicillin G amidase